MAFRINTVEYAWESEQTTVSGSTLYTSPTKSIYIAETGSRTFIAADLHFYVRDGISGTTIPGLVFGNRASFGISIDGNYVTQSVVSTNLSTTGDHFSLLLISNFQNHFNTYFLSQRHDVQFTFQTPTASNSMPFTQHGAKLIFTYQFDDTNVTTATKTVRIPLHSHQSYDRQNTFNTYGIPALSGSANFTNIPKLDTWLPETDKNFTDIFFEVHVKDAASANTRVSQSLRLNSSIQSKRSTFSSSLNTSVYICDIWSVSNSLNTSTTYSFESAASAASRITNSSPILYVTYTYNPITSTRIMNSLICPVYNDLSNQSVTNYFWASIPSFKYVKLFIPEPNPILKQSSYTTILNYGNATSWQYSDIYNTIVNHNIGSTESGPNFNLVLFDSASTALSLPRINSIKRGFNNLVIAVDDGGNNGVVSPKYQFLYLNYESDNIGSLQQNKSIYFPCTQSRVTSAGTFQFKNSALNKNIHAHITSSYYINSVLEYYSILINGSFQNIRVAHLYTGSFIETGSYTYTLMTATDAELGNVFVLNNNTPIFKTTPYHGVSESYKLNYFNANDITLLSTNNSPCISTIYNWVTMNNLLYYISCSLLNCNFPNEEYHIYFYTSGSVSNLSNPINILELSGSNTNKSGSFDWYDNFQNIYAVCYKPEFGISNMLTAGSGSHIIDFSSTATAGEHSYTFIG